MLYKPTYKATYITYLLILRTCSLITYVRDVLTYVRYRTLHTCLIKYLLKPMAHDPILPQCSIMSKFLVPDKSGTRMHDRLTKLLVRDSNASNLDRELGSCYAHYYNRYCVRCGTTVQHVCRFLSANICQPLQT